MPSKVEIDTSLVRPWSLDLVDSEPFEYPFSVHYRTGSTSLTYIASLHTPLAGSPTFHLIDRELKPEKVEHLLVEGILSSSGLSPSATLKWACAQGGDGRFEGFETAYAISLAHKRDIPFAGIEPKDENVFSDLREAGYQLTRSFDLPERLGTPSTLGRFHSWYETGNGRPFKLEEISPEVPAPFENGPLLTQRVSSAVCKSRDRFMLTQIENAMNEHLSTVVIVGGSHWSTQRVALETALGAPSIESIPPTHQ